MDLRANNDNNRNNIDSEMSAFEKFEAEVKNTIFGVLFILLKEQEISIYTGFIIAIIQFIQLMIFPFHATIKDTWNSHDVTKVLNQIFEYLNIVPYLDDTNWNLYIVFFYIGIAVVAIHLICVFYVSYAFSRRRFSFTWPLIALRYISMTFMSVLFLPFLNYFVSILACVDSNAGLVHSYYSEVQCWTGIYILHAIFAILITILFLVITAVLSLTYFEYKAVSNDPTAKVNSRPTFLLLVYKAVMIICLTFLTGDQFQILLIALILIGSLILFMKFYFNSTYHNEIVSKLWSTIMAVNLWTATMLVFAKIMEDTLFEGSIIAWLLGIPFVVLIILTNRDHRVDLLLINVNKFQNGQEVQDQIRYLLKLIEWQSTNRNSAILLDGYIEIHKQSCNKDDCPLKQKVIKNNRFTKNLMSQDETLNEKYALLIQLLYKMYSYGIKKFPNNTSLRIAYAFFLVEKMQSKQQALQELSQAEQNKPPFDEQFIIYRYKKIIEDEIAESQNEGQLDVVSEVAFQNHLRQLQANIEKSALLHMEFWSQLSEDNPDLAKLNDIGSKINSSIHNVEEHWNKLLKINASNAKAMRLYGKFLIEIINDKEAGDELLEKARNLMNVQSNKKAIQMVGVAGDDSNSDATPTVWVSGEQDKFAMITGINLAAASLFGYNKTELLNRKVNVLMPQVYGKHHDSFLENYLNTGEGGIIGKNKERLIFGKNKSNYIFPIYISLRAVQSIIQGIQFIATFRVEKNFKSAAYVLTQPDGTIDSLSSSSINILKIDHKVVNQKKANIQDYIPNIVKDRYTMFSSSNNAGGRATTTLSYNYPKDSEYLLENEDGAIQLNVHLYEMVFLGGRENAGFHFRFERVIDKSISTAQADKKAKISNFHFKFEKNKASIIGEYAEGTTTTDLQSGPSDEEILNGIQNTDQDKSEMMDRTAPFNSAKKSNQEEEVEVDKIDYGAGIKTLRLVAGRPQEIEDENRSEEEEDGFEVAKDKASDNNSQSKQHQQLNQQEEDNQEEGSYRDFSTTFKSRKALTTVVNDKTPPTAIRSLKYTTNVLGLLLFLIALLDYVLAITEYKSIKTDIDLLDKSNLRLAQMMAVLSNIRDINLVRVGLFIPATSTYNSTYLLAKLQENLDYAKSLQEELEQSTSSLSDAHLNLLNGNSVTLYSSDGTSTTTGLIQATQQILSRAYDLESTVYTSISPSNQDYYYVVYNLLNNYYEGLQQSSEYYAIELQDKVNQRGSSFLILLCASIATLILGYLILLPILIQVSKTREEVLSLFLDIPEKTVKGLYNKCETFISNLQVGEDEDMVSEIDEEELEKHQHEHESQDFIPRRRRKRFKNSGRSQRSFFAKFLLVGLAIEAYFIYAYASADVLLKDVSTLIPELNSTSVAEPFFSFANNVERQLFINKSMQVLGTTALSVATANINAMYDLDSLILEDHSINTKIHSNDYANTFNAIMMSNPCGYLTSYVANATCVAFADQTVYQGMTVALSRHFENLRTLLSCYSQIILGSTCTAQVATASEQAILGDTDTTLVTKHLYNLMITTQATEINTMQYVYIKNTFRILMSSFKESLKNKFSDNLTVRLVIFIIFCVLIVCIYVFLWLSLVRNITNDIWRTKSMLNMIPLSVIAKIKSIRLYLKRFWNERNLAEY